MSYELSSMQKTFVNNIFNPMWNHGVIYFFKKHYSFKQLNDAINSLAKTFDALRVCSNGGDNLYFVNHVSYEYPFYSFESKEELFSFAKEFINKPFCKNELLAKFVVFEVQKQVGIISCVHHLSIDGYSGALAIEYINNYLKGLNVDDVQRQSYTEFIEKEKEYKRSKRCASDKKFWSEQFDLSPDCSLYDSKKVTLDYASDELNFELDANIFNAIKDFCELNEVSVQTFFNTIYSVYTYRTLDLNFFTLGVPVINRTTKVEYNSGGLYMHIVPLIVKMSEKSFLQNLIEIEDAQFTLFRHQKFSQDDIKELLKESGKSQNTLFDIATDYQEFPENEDYEFEFVYSNSLSLPLEIHMQSFGEKKHNLKIRYRTSMFTKKEIQTMLNSFIAIIEDVLENPYKKITELNMMSEDEKHKILYDFNNNSSEYFKDKCIHEMFEKQVEKTPDKTAVVAEDKILTYRQLNECANRIANSLIEKGVGTGDIVALMLPRKSCFITALFAVLKTGAAYLPLDSEFPEERINYIISDSKAKFCITEDNFDVLLENRATENIVNSAKPDNFCYCIYTSGSTGAPKGTLLYHRNLVWYMSVLKKLYGTDSVNMPFFTSQSVDLTVPSIYLPLITGGITYIYNGELKNDLVKIFNNENLNIIKFTPTHMSIANKLVDDKICHNIRCVIVGGESLYKEACVEFLNKFGNHIEIHNEYGPTETTVSCTDYIFESDVKTDKDYLPIGKPVNNVQLYITDKYMQPVPIGVTGELCIAGDGVGAGYLNNPELTAEKFIDNPFGEGELYRTGDLAYWCEDGSIVFVGRRDFQVKIRGLRIELGEIENAVLGIDGINMSAAVVRMDKQDIPLICVFYTGERKEVGQIRERLSECLPKYMLPHIYTHLENMPMTISGKVDRKALPEIDLENISAEVEYVAPGNIKEKVLSDAICAVMKLDSISLQENFFNIGGDSIKAIYIVSELEERGYELHVSDVMQSETFSEMAKAMKSISEKVIYDQEEVTGFIPFTPIMRTYLKENDVISKCFVHTCTVSVDCDEKIVVKALDALISHHDILRGTICENGINIHSSNERTVYSFERITADDTDGFKKYIKEKTFDDDKLIHITFCSTNKENLVCIAVHHFLIDLVSWEIFVEDFFEVIEQLKNKKSISLPAKTASFKLWNEELQKYSESISEESKEYWKSVDEKLNNARALCTDDGVFKRIEKITFNLDESTTNKLIKDANYSYGTKANELLITALGLATAEMSGGTVGIIVESHGRTELNKPIAIEHTVGWFTVCYPVVVDNNLNITDELINVKETLRRIPRSGIDYLLLYQDFHKNAEIKFNFYQNNVVDKNEKKHFVGFSSDGSVFRNKINVDCSVIDGILNVSISIPEGKYKVRLGEKLGIAFREYIEKLVATCTENNAVIKTCSDFSDDDLTETELNELKDLFDWTDAYEQ